MSEEWRAVQGWSAYEVSSMGRVRRVGAAKGATVGAVLATEVNGGGYHRVSLSQPGRPGRRVLVHRLVAHAFLGQRPDSLDAHHEDGDKDNNAASNLRYVTRSENLKHAYRTGLKKPYQRRHM